MADRPLVGSSIGTVTGVASATSGRRGAVGRLEVWTRPRPWVADAALAVLVAAPLAASSVSLVSGSRAPGHWAAGLLAAVAVVHLALVGRRTWPLASFVVITFAVLVLGVAPDLTVAPGAGSGAGREGTAFAPILLPSSAVFFVALYGVAAYGRRPVPGVGLTVGVLGAGLVTARLAQAPDVAPGTTLGGPVQIGFVLAALLAAVGAAWGLGLFRRMRSAYVHALEEEARRADELRAERARAAAREERTRIAREMHDMVAHSLAVIVRQADAAGYAARADPAAAEQVLATVAATGREALRDMRNLLGVLRRDDTLDGPEDFGPQPTLADLPDLITVVRGSGLPVTLIEHGPAVPLDRAGELAAYRLVQEALTNVVKHAGADARADVQLGWMTGGSP